MKNLKMTKISVGTLVGKIDGKEESAQLASGDRNIGGGKGDWRVLAKRHALSIQVLHSRGFFVCSFFFFGLLHFWPPWESTQSSPACLLDKARRSIPLPTIPMVGN